MLTIFYRFGTIHDYSSCPGKGAFLKESERSKRTLPEHFNEGLDPVLGLFERLHSREFSQLNTNGRKPGTFFYDIGDHPGNCALVIASPVIHENDTVCP